MKKITVLLLAFIILFCAISSFAVTYIVKEGSPGSSIFLKESDGVGIKVVKEYNSSGITRGAGRMGMGMQMH